MTLDLSRFGKKFTTISGILELMRDLGEAASQGEDICMLGAGAPAPVPGVQKILRKRMADMLADGDAFDHMIGDYDPPQGNAPFIDALVGMFRREFGWDLGPANIAITNGSQSAFFFLFNMLAGEFDDGSRRRILLPVVPEYIGYVDLGLSEDMFVAQRPTIELIGDREFKYHTDFASLDIPDDVAALCVSRPTNPSGNVLTDEEVRHLASLAAERGIPLICDNAYGAPFPQILFEDVQPYWDENVIFSMSLSKFGLPATRTGLVVAAPEIIKALTGITAVVSLAPGGIGANLLQRFVETGEMLSISRDVIRPFYQCRAERAAGWVHEYFAGKVDYRLHKCEGSMFLWLWFPSLSITTYELYERLKARGVIVVPGKYFFPGLQEPWDHTQQCIRINYAHGPCMVEEGLKVIADEAAKW